MLSGDSMFVNIGSPSNSCQIANRQLHSPGVAPCSELATRAGIWKFDANTLEQTLSCGSVSRIATGMRNTNALAVEVFAPTPPDLQTTWVDWNPSPPDKDMGLWQPVSLVALRKLRRDPELSGRGRAIFGLVAGILTTLLYCVPILILLLGGGRR